MEKRLSEVEKITKIEGLIANIRDSLATIETDIRRVMYLIIGFTVVLATLSAIGFN